MIFRGHIFLGLGLMAILVLVGLMAVSVLAGTGATERVLVRVAEAADDDRPISGEARNKCIAAALAEYPEGTVTETEVGDDGAAYGVEVRFKDGSEVEVYLNGDCQVIGQEADDDGQEDDDRPISGEARDKCIAAALAEHPGGTVTETEVGDDGAAYEVEIRHEDRSQIEVQLNENCQVTGQEDDDDGREDDDD